MPETRAKSNVNMSEDQPLSHDIISNLINNSIATLQETFCTQLTQLTVEIKKVNDTLLNQQQDILSIRDVIIKNLQEDNTRTKERVANLEAKLVEQEHENSALRKEIGDLKSSFHDLERCTYRTAEYVNYETLEVSNIPMTIPAAQVPEVTLGITNALGEAGDEAFGMNDVHAIHRRQGFFTKEKVLVKFVRRGDAFYTLKKAKNLRKLDPKVIDERLIKPIYINEHLSPYYSKLRYACKLLKNQHMINDFWVSGHKIKVKTLGNLIEIISHKNDLMKVISGDITSVIDQCKL